MSETASFRNYSLTGPEAPLAEQRGLASAQWYTTPIPRPRMKDLMQRRNGPAIRDTILWFAILGVSGWAGWYFWGTALAALAFFVYGTVYSSSSDSRWHECSHGTAFKTRWMNDALYEIASFFVLRESTPWRWSHARHHSDTIVVGRDPEISFPRPTSLISIAMGFFNIRGGISELSKMVKHAFTGKLSLAEQSYVPESDWARTCWTARIYLTIFAGFSAWAIAIGSILPLMYVLLPSFYGAWHMMLVGITQHAGLAEDVLDHRLNCRTVYMNPITRYLYWNMNYHVEHHMFPLVPYHRLPELHAEMRHDTPTPYPSIFAAYREIIPTLLKQAKDPTYFARRPLPGTTTAPLAAPVLSESVAVAV
jgi:fatty acid desaturase